MKNTLESFREILFKNGYLSEITVISPLLHSDKNLAVSLAEYLVLPYVAKGGFRAADKVAMVANEIIDEENIPKDDKIICVLSVKCKESVSCHIPVHCIATLVTTHNGDLKPHEFFENFSCKYYPCHKGVDRINCLFCYCPLYNMEECPGNPVFIDGKKDCSVCVFPHLMYNYNKIIKILLTNS